MRIKIIDGFRAIAVMGVLWAHIWMFSGTPSFLVSGIDIAKIISFFGTGVDLFFVISGFCMYLMYASKQNKYSSKEYIIYIKKRWLRIAPAFYAGVILYGLAAVSFNLSLFNWSYALKQILFIRNFFKDPSLYAPHFWSLCTEWQFYMVLPFIILGLQKWSFKKMMIVAIIITMTFRALAWINNSDAFNLINYSIPNRLVEFLIGIITARLYLSKQEGWLFKTVFGLITGIAIAFTGRMLMTAGMQERSDALGVISRVLNLPLLTIGYGLVIINTLQFRSLFSSLLETPVFTSIGKYSYSLYLWHWWVAEDLTKFCKQWNLNSFLQVNVVFVLSMFLLYPLSIISYSLFESIYFKRRNSKRPVALPS